MDFSWMPSLQQYTPHQRAPLPPAYNSNTAPVSVLNKDVQGYDPALKPTFQPAYNPANAPVTLVNAGPLGQQSPPAIAAYAGPGDGSAHDPTQAPTVLKSFGSIGRDIGDWLFPRKYRAPGAEDAPSPGAMPAIAAADGLGAIPDSTKVTTMKTKPVSLESVMQQRMAGMPGQQKQVDPADYTKTLPLGTLMEMAKLTAGARRPVPIRDHIAGQVYGWQRARYLDAMQKGDKAGAADALAAITAIANAQSFNAMQMWGAGLGQD